MNTIYIALDANMSKKENLEDVLCLCAGDGESVHVLAGRLNGNLLNNGLELGGGDLNLLDLGLKGLVGDGGVSVGQGLSGIGEWDSVVGVGVVVGEESSLGGNSDSLCGLLFSSLCGLLFSSLGGSSLSGCSLSIRVLGRPLGLGGSAWHTDSKAVLASGVDKLSLVGLDLNLVLLGDELLDDGLVVVDKG